MAYFGVADVSNITIDGSSEKNLNWTEITIPEVLTVPVQKPDIECINQVYADVAITCVKLIETPFAYEEVCNCTVATSDQIAAAGSIITLVEALGLDNIVTTVINPIQALLTTIGNINLTPLGISLDAFIDPIQATLDSLTDTITAVTDLLVTITASLANPETTICTLTTLFTQLKTLLTTLLSILPALLEQLNSLLEEIQRIIETIPGAGLILGAVLTTIQNLLGAITPIIQTLITSLGQILTVIDELINGLCPNCIKLLPNEEGTILTGRKLIIEGIINQKIVYTALVPTQSVHSAHYSIPFSAFVIPYAKFVDMPYDLEDDCFSYTPGQPITVDLNEDFNVTAYIEDIVAYALDTRTIFKNVTLFIKAQSKY